MSEVWGESPEGRGLKLELRAPHRGLGTVCKGRRGGLGKTSRGCVRTPLALAPPLTLLLLLSAASYFDALVKVRKLRGTDRGFLSWNDLQAAVCEVNAQVQEETDRECPSDSLSRGLEFGAAAHPQMSSSEVLAISLINEALDQGYPEKTLSALLLPAAGLEDVSLHVALRYHLLLVAAKKKKAKVRLGKDGWVRH